MSDQLVASSIEHVDRVDFEVWVQKVLLTVEGYRFEPTGGVHDGGQDGFLRPIDGDPHHFVQISKEKDTRAKIRKTLSALNKTRQVSKLTYVTSQPESDIDIIEAKLTKDYGLPIKIHNRRWLVIQAGLYTILKESLFGYARTFIDSLKQASRVKRELNFSDRLSIITYLETHSRAMETAADFQSLCLDTLVYDALIGTDPDQNSFRTEEQIRADIHSKHANVLSKSPENLTERLAWLSSKQNALRIRKHKQDQYALPYEVRNQFDEGNLNIKTQEDEFVASIQARVTEKLSDVDVELQNLVAGAVQHTVGETFRKQALNFVSSFSDLSAESNIEVFSIIDDFFEGEGLTSDQLELCTLATGNVFRNVCYSSNQQEREYVELLMKYFSVRFVMDGDVAVTRYFSEMAKRLRIYLGTDIIVRSLSEIFVRPSSRGMTNALQKLQESGVAFHLTRQVAEEVLSHIHVTYLTFRDDYENWYRRGSLEELKNCEKILIRAFFYAYFEPEKHVRKARDWSDFLSQMGNAAWFADKNRNIDDFTSYLVDKFHFEFVETRDLLAKIDHKLSERVAQNIMDDRDKVSSLGNQILAHNDAQMALLVNAERLENNERVTSDLYGYNTWWMTEEKTVLKALREAGEPDDVVMQPQFLINHYLLDQTIRKRPESSNTPLTPTLFGLRITNRVDGAVMRKFLNKVGEYAELDEAASRAKIRSAANRLKRS